MPSTRELWCFMMMIRSYEPGVVDIIFKCVKSYTFKRKEELKGFLKKIDILIEKKK